MQLQKSIVAKLTQLIELCTLKNLNEDNSNKILLKVL